MNSFGSQLSVDGWSFWSSESRSPAEWLSIRCGEVEGPAAQALTADLIPPMQRRRMSMLSKMAVQTALAATRDVTPHYIVFTSRHGEIVRTRKLLSDLSAGTELSPTEFSQSVHNTGAGLYSIIRKSQAPATALASGAASFAYGWLDAEGYLAERPGDTVLLVDCDDVLPDEYRAFVAQEPAAYALAVVLTAAGEDGVSLTIGPGDSDSLQPMGPQVLSWLLSAQASLRVDAEGQGFTWARASGA